MAEKIPEVRNGGTNGGNGSHSYTVQPKSEGTSPRDVSGQAGASREGLEGRYWTEARARVGREEFEHGRAGFRDFGTPSPGQGRQVRPDEHTAERDFNARDDRFAGRSGSSYHPENMGPPQTYRTGQQSWRPPEEDWERAHHGTWAQHPRHAPQRRGHLWEREPATARDIMTANPRSVRREGTLREVAIIMRDESCGIVPVVDAAERLVGVITDRDIVMRTIDIERPWQQIRAEEVMSDDVECATPDESVEQIIRMMGKNQVRRVPVVDRGDRLIGMIAMADVANRANEDEELQHALDKISKKRSFWSRLGI